VPAQPHAVLADRPVEARCGTDNPLGRRRPRQRRNAAMRINSVARLSAIRQTPPGGVATAMSELTPTAAQAAGRDDGRHPTAVSAAGATAPASKFSATLSATAPRAAGPLGLGGRCSGRVSRPSPGRPFQECASSAQRRGVRSALVAIPGRDEPERQSCALPGSMRPTCRRRRSRPTRCCLSA
jgi:hypothetical protein